MEIPEIRQILAAKHIVPGVVFKYAEYKSPEHILRKILKVEIKDMGGMWEVFVDSIYLVHYIYGERHNEVRFEYRNNDYSIESLDTYFCKGTTIVPSAIFNDALKEVLQFTKKFKRISKKGLK